ncbi:MAG: histidine kinase [Caulobacter sp.]|nr:histidine kinase [Caulobacter sp.]
MRRFLRGRLGPDEPEETVAAHPVHKSAGDARTIRARLAGALALALIPVLFLGAVQSALSFRREAGQQREALQSAAQRSVASAKARMDASAILLETLAPRVVGLDCASRLGDITRRLPGYANLIRFDAQGRVACAAASAPADAERRYRPWFHQLFTGKTSTMTLEPGVAYAREPVLLASVRAGPEADGVLTAVIPLSTLRPETEGRALPTDAAVALVDETGRILSASDDKAFPTIPKAWIDKANGPEGATITAPGARGGERVYSIAPLVGDGLYVVLSAPSKGILSSDWLDPLSGLVFPLLAFSVALLAVFWAADQSVVRWIIYLQRIADIYARGRFSVRPLQAEAAPPEIRQLAETLDEMAAAIVARDTTLQENLTQKDDLLREIHHRVKNNLQVISSLLSMQERALTDPGARQAINDTRQRITALALNYRALYQGSDLRHADLRPFLEELTAQLMMSETAQGTVKVEVRADPLIIDPDKLAPVALFAVEAITNAQKHGLADHGGALTVDFKVDGPDATLSISDDGGGLRPPLDTLEAKGVGRTLMTAFSRQLRGRTEMSINPAGGLTVTLVFPTPESVD